MVIDRYNYCAVVRKCKRAKVSVKEEVFEREMFIRVMTGNTYEVVVENNYLFLIEQ